MTLPLGDPAVTRFCVPLPDSRFGLILATLAVVHLYVPTESVAQTPPRLSYRIERIDEESGFGRPSAMSVGPDGRLYAAYSARRVIRIRADDGSGWETLPLTGVEETGIPSRLGWRGDTLWVSDWRPNRLVLLETGTGVTRSVRVFLPDPSIGPGGHRILAVLPEDRLIVETSTSIGSMAFADPRYAHLREIFPPQLPLPFPVGHLPVWIVRPEGVVLDTVVKLPTRNRALYVQLPPETDAAGRMIAENRQGTQPFANHPLVAVGEAGERLLIVDRSIRADAERPSFTLHWLTMAGDTVRTREFAHETVPIPDRTVEDWADRLIEGFGSDSAEARRAAEKALYRPPWFPPVSGVLMGPSGWIWLRREAVPGARDVIWEIVDPDGRRLGSVELDAGLRLDAVAGRTAWATVETEDERYEIRRIEVIQPPHPDQGRIHHERMSSIFSLNRSIASCGAVHTFPGVVPVVRRKSADRAEGVE
ncbi:MAG: hypothetical protein RQ745_11585 [Longimicrobiales bacterium]|nr:hypothetical protein [Longimicrobiales bacterium]